MVFYKHKQTNLTLFALPNNFGSPASPRQIAQTIDDFPVPKNNNQILLQNVNWKITKYYIVAILACRLQVMYIGNKYIVIYKIYHFLYLITVYIIYNMKLLNLKWRYSTCQAIFY